MKKLQTILTLLIVVIAFGTAHADKKKKANKATEAWRYDIECAGVGSDGTYMVKVWSYSKKAQIATEQSKKNAVHGIIFKGIAGKTQGCPAQKPIARNPTLQQEQSDYFKKFFSDGGDYMKYVLSASRGLEKVKIGREYKVGVVISVAKDQLRKDLETAGIIKGLSTGF
ncbi:MAG: hypothetical protein RR393_02190 [Bacteroidales bacterium]